MTAAWSDHTRILETEGPRTVSAPGYELVVIDGADRGLRKAIGTVTRVGSADGNDLKLTDPTVSRVHFGVGREPKGLRVRDLGSTNGTFLDGVRVRDAYLAPGSFLRVGSTTLRAESASEPVRIELSHKSRLSGLLGASAPMRQMYSTIERVAPTDATVLLQGETGTGKELVARAIHEHSARADRRFVAIDCGAIAENLVESELFGHVRGAFSGAVIDRMGAFEEADGGTLFFDEVGELTLGMQRKLLRAIESREIRRVGANREKKVDVRIVAATHRSLAAGANEGTFREDLFFRLAVVTIELPPLRRRREDIAMLAQHFLDRFSQGRARLEPNLLTTLLTRSWQGNVRELRNFIERHVSLDAPVKPSDAAPSSDDFRPDWLRLDLPFKDAQSAVLEAFERSYLRAMLERSSGNVTRAAEDAGVSRRFLQRRMLDLGLREGGDAADAFSRLKA